MKKILSLLTIITLTASSTCGVISCKNNNPSTLTASELKSEFKNTHLTIDFWNNFWGNLNNTLNKKTYYQLLVDRLFNQNKINLKNEKYFELQTSDQPFKKVSILNPIKENQIESKTKLRGQIHIGDNYTFLKSINVDWTLTTDQQNIYPLINRVKNQNHLAIYDTNTTDKYNPKTNPKIAVSSYSSLKNLFNNQYQKDTSDITDYFTQYTNFTIDLKNKTIFTNGNNSLFGLKIHSLDKKSIYEDKDFIINFYNIKNIGDSLNKYFSNKDHYILAIFNSTNPNDPNNQLLSLIYSRVPEEDVPGISKLKNFKNKITFSGTLPTGSDKTLRIIKMIYDNKIIANIRVGEE